jgi:hypothetical protein
MGSVSSKCPAPLMTCQRPVGEKGAGRIVRSGHRLGGHVAGLPRQEAARLRFAYNAAHSSGGDSVRPKARDDVAVADIDGESVLYDPAEDGLYHLNQSAAIAFQLCDGTGTADEIALDMAEVSGQPIDETLDQFRHMIHHFEGLGLLEGSVATWNREPDPGSDHAQEHEQHDHEQHDEELDETPKDRSDLEEPETQNH